MIATRQGRSDTGGRKDRLTSVYACLVHLLRETPDRVERPICGRGPVVVKRKPTAGVVTGGIKKRIYISAHTKIGGTGLSKHGQPQSAAPAQANRGGQSKSRVSNVTSCAPFWEMITLLAMVTA